MAELGGLGRRAGSQPCLPPNLNLCGCSGWLLGKGHRVGRASREGGVPRKAARGNVCCVLAIWVMAGTA